MLGKADYHISFREFLVDKAFLPKSSHFDILNFNLINFVRKAALPLCILAQIFANIQNYPHAVELGINSSWLKKNSNTSDYKREHCDVRSKVDLIQSGSKKIIYSSSRSKIHPTKDGRVRLVIQDNDGFDGRF